MTEKEKERAVYLNACDCLLYGYGKSHCNKCGLPDDVFSRIWEKARKDMSKL